MEKGSWWTALTASETANFLSGLACVANEARFPDTLAFLRGMIVEWSFPMHLENAGPLTTDRVDLNSQERILRRPT